MYRTQHDLDKAAGKCKEEQYHVEWRGRAYGALKNSDQRKSVLRKAIMKSGRLNHANVRPTLSLCLRRASGRARADEFRARPQIMLIVHQPLAADCVQDGSAPSQYEAFLLIGSHTPYVLAHCPPELSSPCSPLTSPFVARSTPASWGEYSFSASQPAPTVKMQHHEVSVVYRLASAATWDELKSEINDAVPYVRPLKRYDEDDEPAPTAAPRPEPKKRGRKAKEKDD